MQIQSLRLTGLQAAIAQLTAEKTQLQADNAALKKAADELGGKYRDLATQFRD
jgi:cell division protein FtsB